MARLPRDEVLKVLIDHGADLHAKTADGQSVLQVAKQAGYQKIVAILTDAGATD